MRSLNHPVPPEMDACTQLRRDIADAVAERDRNLELAQRRFWLGLLGLEFVLDWEDRNAVDRGLGTFLALVQAGEIVLAIQGLATLLTGIAQRMGSIAARRLMGRWASRTLGVVALTMLALDVVVGYARWEEEADGVRQRFRARLRELLETTTCPSPEDVFEDKGVEVP